MCDSLKWGICGRSEPVAEYNLIRPRLIRQQGGPKRAGQPRIENAEKSRAKQLVGC